MKYYIIAFIIILLDQLTKWMVVEWMELRERIEIVPNFFHLTSHRNSGAAWGMLEDQMLLFYVVTVIVVGVIVYLMQSYKEGFHLLKLGLAFILGGAIGNFIDRVRIQEVVDFFDFQIINYNFPIFNIADMALTVGVIIVIIIILFEEWITKGKSENDGTTKD
ncbi:signal peptidase II [Halalkalibacillus halophilus]|uniref:signal peptidase II n=1 Tax=Halalkalibacillus halophilus TaxID=392827 RepID=UPI0003F7918D|nr:signal peptidase II [Halalkalibacillus halophilus]